VKRQGGLFCGFWTWNGERLSRARRSDLAEAYRLWAVHRDIREGRVRAEPPVFSMIFAGRRL
jgi:hypothetical protein